MLRIAIRISVLSVLVLGTSLAFAFVGGPPPSRTGAPAIGSVPAESNCIACHSGQPLNDPSGAFEILDVPAIYTPGATYPLRVRLAYPHLPSVTNPKWGFEITAVGADGEGAGEFGLPDGAGSPGFQDSLQVILGTGMFSGRTYVTHTEFSSRAGQTGPVEWSFDWIAPPTDIGRVGFFAAGNAANGNFSFSGDRIFTTIARSDGPSLLSAPGTGNAAWLTLEAARPNPFRARTEMRFALPRAGHVSLVVHDLQGRRIRTLLDAARPAGEGRAMWDGTGDDGRAAPNGAYFVRLRAPGEAATVQRQVTLAR